MSARHPLVPAFHPRLPRSARGRWLAALALLVVAAGGAWKLSRRGPAGPAYREHVVARGDLKVAISAAGEVSPQNRIELRPPLSGRIEQILVREGDTIRKGQVLLWMSSNDRASLLDAARAKSPEEAARWEDAYKPTPLVAPLGGFIIARRAEPGQNIGGGDPPLVMADRLIVRAQVDETDMGKVKVGQRAEVSLDAYPDIRLPGRVDHLAYEARNVNNVTVYDLEVELLKSSGVLRSGMTATVSVVTAERLRAILIPAEALAEVNGELTVTRKGPGGKPVSIPVTIGASDGADVEVTKGLKEGEVLLVSTRAVGPSVLSETGSPFTPKAWRNQRRGGGAGGGRR
ncbi:MAG: HlyD family efflux transporter periplasmic adaptor subunit [bacterium]